MSGSELPQDVAARDDAHLESLGIKPELQRTLGFLSNFAVAFSYISVATGTFTLMALGLGVGGPAFFWSWPIIILGQTFVALNFAELASHFPVAGSIYQWSKRLSNRTLGWFTGWFYFWAGVVTVTAVAGTVPLVLSTITRHGPDRRVAVADVQQPGLLGAHHARRDHHHQQHRRTDLAHDQQHRGRRRDPGHARLRAHPLLFFRVQDLSVLTTTAALETPETGGYLPVFAIAMFMSLFVVYGFDTAGTFGEETLDASRQAPRGILSAIWLSGIVGAIFLLAIILATPDMTAALTDRSRSRRPSSRALGETFGNVYLAVILIAVFVCTLAIQGATVRLMFSMGRDRRMPLGGLWGKVKWHQDAGQRGRRRGRPGRAAVLPDRQPGPHRDRRDRPHLPVLLPVQPRRARRPAARLAPPAGLVQARRLGDWS